MTSNNPPDVILELSSEEASFLLKNCISNRRLGLSIIMGISEEDISREEMMEKAEPYVQLNEKFGVIMKKLQRAGAREE